MRRADRLMKITHFLRRRRRAVTAKRIAEEFEICTRTVYRDIRDLISTGVPISGEAGVGYLIDKDYYLPPMTFDMEELEAIGLGISVVRQWTDENFAIKANSAFDKIRAALPSGLQSEFQQVTTYAVLGETKLPWSVSFSHLRECIRERRKIYIDYTDENKKATTRVVRPLALLFFGPVWLLGAWCEKREAFRNFRLDRIDEIDYLDELFDDEAGKNLTAYQQQNPDCNSTE